MPAFNRFSAAALAIALLAQPAFAGAQRCDAIEGDLRFIATLENDAPARLAGVTAGIRDLADTLQSARAEARHAGCPERAGSFHIVGCAALVEEIEALEARFADLRHRRDLLVGAADAAAARRQAENAFAAASCGPAAEPASRASAVVHEGSLLIVGAGEAGTEAAAQAEPAPVWIDPATRRDVRVVGPRFLPDRSEAIDLRSPGPNPAR